MQIKIIIELQESVDICTNLFTNTVNTVILASTSVQPAHSNYPKEISDQVKERRKARHR